MQSYQNHVETYTVYSMYYYNQNYLLNLEDYMQLETSVTNIILKFDNDVNDRNNRIFFFRCLGLRGEGETGVVCFVLFFYRPGI